VSTPTVRPIQVLYVGTDEETPHNPTKMFPLLAAPLARRGIQLTFSRTALEAIDPAKLQYYDAVMIYGDRLSLTPAEEKALSAFVDGGHGLVGIHAVGDLSLVGAKLMPQGGAEFTAEIVQPANPVVQGLQPFAAWEEPLAPMPTGQRTVVMERVNGQTRQPWTWLQTQGKGRIFYTGYGHDERTWSQPAFQSLIERGIVWSVDEPRRRNWQQLEMPGVIRGSNFVSECGRGWNRARASRQLAAQPEQAARIGAADVDHPSGGVGQFENAQLPGQRIERCDFDRQPRFDTANLHVSLPARL